MLSFFLRDALDATLDLNELVSEGFSSYSRKPNLVSLANYFFLCVRRL